MSNRYRFLKYLPVWFFELNLFQEFKIIDRFIQKSMSNPIFVWTNLKFYFSFYFLWAFIWKKFCLFYNLKKNGCIWNWRYYFLFGKFRWYKFFFKNLIISPGLINFRKIQNLYLETILHFLIEPLFEGCFKLFAFGFRPFNTILGGLKCLIRNLKKYSFIWILFGELYFCFENFNVNLFFSLILKRIWDFFLLKLVNSWLFTTIYFNQIKKIVFLPIGSSSFLMPLFSNLYFEFLDDFFIGLLFFSKKKIVKIWVLQFFSYAKSMNCFQYCKIKYVFFFVNYLYVLKKYMIELIKYLRIYQILLFCTNYSFNFVLLLKEKLILFLQCKFFCSMDQVIYLTIKNMFQGLSIFGFCLKKKNFLIELYIEKKKVIQYLKFKGFCNKIGLPIPCFKFLSWTLPNLHLKINFLIQLLNFWWFKGNNKIKIMSFFMYIIRHSLNKLYSSKYKKYFLSKGFCLSGGTFNIN